MFDILIVVLLLLDFDGDDMLGKSDLRQVIQRLIGFNNSFSDLEIEQLIQNIMEEADLDDDGSLSFAEFEHVIDKSSDFTKYAQAEVSYVTFILIWSFFSFSSFRIRL